MNEHQAVEPVEQEHDSTTYELDRMLRAIYEATCRQQTPAELAPLAFDGSKNEFERLDDAGAPGLSYGLFNPTSARAYIAFAGGPARREAALPVPPESVLVMPIATGGAITVGLDSEDLGANRATLYRLRFHSVQPFFLGRL